MKPTNPWIGRVIILFFLSAFTLALVSWQGQKQAGFDQQQQVDTVPKKIKDRQPKDLDEVLAELEGLDIEETMQKAMQEMEKAMKELDGNKIKLELEKAMKEVDFEKLQREIKESFASVDFDKIKKELSESMKEIDMSKMEAEIRESMKEVDMEKIKKEMENLRKIDMKGLEDEMNRLHEKLKDIGPEIAREMDKAKLEIEKAKNEIREFKTFVDGLEKDGLISKKEGFTIRHKNGELFINDKKASESTYNKYRSFLEKHREFRLVQNDDDFNLDMDED